MQTTNRPDQTANSGVESDGAAPLHAQASSPVPAAATFEVERGAFDDTGYTVTQGCPDHILDDRGAPATGMIFLLADHALGAAIFSRIGLNDRIVTSHLHVEMLRALPPGLTRLIGHGEVIDVMPGSGFARGRATSAEGGVLAVFSARFALFGADQQQGGAVTGEAAPVYPGRRSPLLAHALTNSPVHDLLRTNVLDVVGVQVRVTMDARTEFANERGGLHGGAGALMGERVGDLALRSVAGSERRYRPVELRVVFLRPVPADGTALVAEAEVAYIGRTTATTTARLLRADGKVAVQVDAVHAAVLD